MQSSLLGGAAFAAAVAAVVAAGTWNCRGDSAPAVMPTPTPPPATNVTVTIVGSAGVKAFSPNPVMVGAGDTLIFKNSDTTMHHLVVDDGSADLGDIPPGSSKWLTAKGSVANFHCIIHSSMVGSINGMEPPEPPPCTTPGYC